MVRRILDFQAAQTKAIGQTAVLDHLEQETHVIVKLSEILPALTDALLTQRAWVQDFEDEFSMMSFVFCISTSIGYPM